MNQEELLRENLRLIADRDLLIKEVNELKVKLADARSVSIEGWKGSDKINICQFEDTWQITEHRKDKNTGEVAKNKHTINHSEVMMLWELIKEECDVGKATQARVLWLKIIQKMHLPLELEEFNGGKNRARHYFPKYYYPAKILEHKGLIRYGGGGKIVRLIP